MEFVFLKNSDVITYVENGIADMGIVGSDVIAEIDSQICCLQKLYIVETGNTLKANGLSAHANAALKRLMDN